jgi:hypothetical protein
MFPHFGVFLSNRTKAEPEMLQGSGNFASMLDVRDSGLVPRAILTDNRRQSAGSKEVQVLERERNSRRETAGSAVHFVPFQQTQAAASFPQATDPASPSGLRRTQAAGPILSFRRRPIRS